MVHSPEFLREKSAAEDTRRPERTIIGVVEREGNTESVIQTLLTILPKAEFELVCSAEEAELIKYGGNVFLTLKVVYMNMLYDLAQAVGAEYATVAMGIGADSRIGTSHTSVIHGTARGAGGHCFPKDIEALLRSYQTLCPTDVPGINFLQSVVNKNNDLLRSTGKDIDLLEQIYGK